MPKVSVIIPVYNAEKYLADALDSVLAQTFLDIEIVCVNDGSDDNSLNILKSYAKVDKRIKIICQKNSGGSAARNSGMKQAIGEYLMFLDADDLYAKDIVTNAYSRAKETGADIVFYNFARFVCKPTRMAVVNKRAPKHDIKFFTKDTYRHRLFNDFAVITWNKLIKKSVITDNKLAFDTTLSHNHDVDFSIRLMLTAESYSWLSKVGYYYRSNDSGLTATKRSDPTNVLKILINLDELIATRYIELKPSFDSYVADMIAGTILKYSKDKDSVKKIFDYSREVVIPTMRLNAERMSAPEPTGLFAMVEAGKYKDIEAYLGSPKRKAKVFMRDLYDFAQGILAKIIV